MILGKKKGSKKDPSPSPLTPPSMESDDIDPTTVIFNQPLPLAARRSDHVWGAVPSPIRLAVDWLNKKGLSEEGIYRVPGKATTFATYKALFDRGVDFDFFELHEMAPENVAMVLIKYLQALPDPIYCAKFEGHFRIALGIVNEQERASVMRGIMYMIPLAYRETCRVLVDHLRLVSGNSDVNKMTLRNVELTWSLSVGQMTGAIVRVLSESPLPVPSTLQYHLPLEIAAQNTPREMSNTTPTVPYAVTTLISWLRDNDGFSQISLFSTESKNHEIVDDIVYVLNGGSLGTEGKFPDEATAWDVANALKQWIADIPGDAGLFPDSMRPDFVRVIPPSGSSGKSINFAEMPDKLEPLVWKLPDIHLETLKALLGMLHMWTTVSPEDNTALQAVEYLFPNYSTPLQHVLTYILFNFDALFGSEDSALAAHLHSLVFASPSGPNALGRLVSPLVSPHHALNAKMTSSSPTTPLNPSMPTFSSSAAPTAPGGENNQTAGDRSDASTSTSPATPGTPTKAYKKSKTLKGTGSSPVTTPGKVKKHREAEDEMSSQSPSSSKSRSGTKNPKSSTPKSTKADRSESPSKGAKGSLTPTTSEADPKPRSRHSKSSSADAESPIKQKSSDIASKSGDTSPTLGTPSTSKPHSRSASSDAAEVPSVSSSSKKSKSRESSSTPTQEDEEEKLSTPTSKREKKSKSPPLETTSATASQTSTITDSPTLLPDSDPSPSPIGSAEMETTGTPQRSKLATVSTTPPTSEGTRDDDLAPKTKKHKKYSSKSSSKSSSDEPEETTEPSTPSASTPSTSADTISAEESSLTTESNGKKKKSKSKQSSAPEATVVDEAAHDQEEVEIEAILSENSSPTSSKAKKRKSATLDTNGSLEKTDKKRDRRKSKGPSSADPVQPSEDSNTQNTGGTAFENTSIGMESELSTELPKKSRKQLVDDPSIASPKKSLKIKVSSPAIEGQ